MQKRGQVTLFIVLGLLLIFLVVMFYLTYSSSLSVDVDKHIENRIDENPIRLVVEECLHSIGNDALIDVGLHGGYYNLPDQTVEEDEILTVYHYIDGNVIAPSKSLVEDQVGKYIDDHIGTCVSDALKLFSQYRVDVGDSRSQAEILPTLVRLNLHLPVTVKQTDSTRTIEDYTFSLKDVRMSEILDINQEMMAWQEEHPYMVCQTCMSEIARSHDVRFEVTRTDDSTYIFAMIDDHSLVEDMPYAFFYAASYQDPCAGMSPSDEDYFILCGGGIDNG